MARESQIKRTKKEKEPVQKKKKAESSDSEGDNGSNDDEDEDEMDETEYRKFLSKIFPSKHLDKKIAAGSRLKKKIQEL